mmetsp:Transcript_4881/g.9188  ORF Transcript_4881/g.9188 Transcript_4881/m.9188 type:complete len:110 (-) Transcript_4881:148-477(-)
MLTSLVDTKWVLGAGKLDPLAAETDATYCKGLANLRNMPRRTLTYFATRWITLTDALARSARMRYSTRFSRLCADDNETAIAASTLASPSPGNSQRAINARASTRDATI